MRLAVGVVVEGWREAGNVLTGGGTFDPKADEILVFGARLPEYDHGGQGFRVDAGNEIGIARALLFPKLTYLDFFHAHVQALTVVRAGWGCQLWS